MAAKMLTGAFAALSVSCSRPCQVQRRPAGALRAARLASGSNGIAAAQQLKAQAATPVAQCAAATVTCKLKLKTRKAAAKRYKVTGGGKVMVRHPGKQHINEKMSRNKLRKLGKMMVVGEPDLNNVKACLPYAHIK